MNRINGWGCFALVSLRLVIGWHFLVEGVHKIQTHQLGKTPTNTPWTGEGFFKEASGPAAGFFRESLGVGDKAALERFENLGQRAPFADAWSDALGDFQQHYEIKDDQANAVKEKWDESLKDTRNWLNGKLATDVKTTMNWGTVELKKTVPQRIAEYKSLVQQIEDAFANRLPAFNKDVEKVHLRTLKADAGKILADLNADLDGRLAELKKSWTALLTDAQKSRGPVPATKTTPLVAKLDKVTMWMQAIFGGCLVLGLFTRFSSFVLAGFLLQITLLAPALPFSPTPPGAVGHYLYVNLYTIEMIALLALAAIPTGRWFGIDSLLHTMFGRRPTTQPRRIGRPVYANRTTN